MPVIPALWETKVGRSQGQGSRPAWPTWWDPISTKNTKIRRVSYRWHTPVIPAIQEAKSGESFEPGRQKLQWAEIAPLYSSLGDRARHRHKQTNKTIYKKHHVRQLNPFTSNLFPLQVVDSVAVVHFRCCRGIVFIKQLLCSRNKCFIFHIWLNLSGPFLIS